MAALRRILFQGNVCKRLELQYVTAGCRSLSTTSRLENDKVYELRTYSLNAKDVKGFTELTMENFHLRTTHSKLVGYWTSEIGGINDVVHIWEYDSLSHRAKVRQSLAADPNWISIYFSKLLPMLSKQDNSLMKCMPGTDISNPPDTGVYEIQHFHYGNQDVKDVSEKVQSFQKRGAALLGSFYNVIGQQSSGCQLWYHPNVDNVVQPPLKVDDTTGIKMGHSRLLLPCPWSVMK